jgi:hypothetical protein
MPRLTTSKTVWGLAVVALAGAVLCVPSLRGQADKEPLTQSAVAAAKDWQKFHYQAATACAECHTTPGRKKTDLAMLTEYSIWQTHDKHAQAYAVLEGPRGKRMGELLGQNVLEPKAGCLNCHGMHNLIAENQEKKSKENLDIRDGVSCGGCHGPSGAAKPADAWIAAHTQAGWRDMTPEQKYKAGMRDLRDPVVRAELCMSCHIGSAVEGKVVTHAMMAAGHPPLPPIEIATFSQNEPQHWRDPAKVPAFVEKTVDLKKYHAENPAFARSRLALAGTIAAVRETFKFVHQRADVNGSGKRDLLWPELSQGKDTAKEPAARWPEIAMAHSDCFACHHDLRFPGFRQERGFGYLVPGVVSDRVYPGRPVVRSWPMAGLAVGASHTGRKLDGLKEALSALTRATNARPFGKPADLAASAKGMVAWCDGLLAELRDAPLDRAKVLKVAREICTLWDRTDAQDRKVVPDYETARQMTSLLQVLFEDLKIKDKAALKALADLRNTLDTEPYYHRQERSDILFKVVRAALGKQDADAAFNKGVDQFRDYLKDVSDPEKLKGLAGANNPFLVTLALGLDNKKFTAELLKPEVVKELQRLSDEEQDRVLKAVSGYDPAAFKTKLQEVLKHLPEK